MSHVCIRERLRAQCPQWEWRAVPSCPCPLGGPLLRLCRIVPTAVASSDNKAPARANCESGNRRAGSHYPTHADSMSKFLSSRSARLFLCFRKQLNIN
jgi:hypothetical protein